MAAREAPALCRSLRVRSRPVSLRTHPIAVAGAVFLLVVVGLVALESPARAAGPSAGAAAPRIAPSVVHPSARWIAPLVYDAADHIGLLFGGQSATATFGDTWNFSAGKWARMSPVHHPSARGAESLAYDARDGYVLLFGGSGPTGTLLNDTWIFSKGDWHQLHPAVSPEARFGAGMIYDARDGYVVLFGGQGSTYLLNDTWKFVAGHWTNISTGVAPPPRRSAGFAYDTGAGLALLFGGLGPTDLNDTWIFHSGSWTAVTSPLLSPAARVAPALTFDARDHYLLLFGGRNDSTGGVYADSWKFVVATRSWAMLTPPASPAARDWPSMAYLANVNEVVLFGGSGSGSSVVPLHDTVTFAKGSWT